jgi:hypothetical protein
MQARKEVTTSPEQPYIRTIEIIRVGGGGGV